MADLFEQGIDYFNRGYFFEAHDVFEELWMDEREESKVFFQGLVQISTGFYHLVMKNLNGAESQLAKGLSKLAGYPPRYYEMDVAGLISNVETCVRKIRLTKGNPVWQQLVELIPRLEWTGTQKETERS